MAKCIYTFYCVTKEEKNYDIETIRIQGSGIVIHIVHPPNQDQIN